MSLCRCFSKYLEVKVRVADAQARRPAPSNTMPSTSQQQPAPPPHGKVKLLPWGRDCAEYRDATGTAVSSVIAKADLLRKLDAINFFMPLRLPNRPQLAYESAP